MKIDQLSVEYFGGTHPLAQFRAEHEAALPAWQANEPVVPIHHPIARIHPEPDVLEWLEGDVRAMKEQAANDLLLGDPNDLGYDPEGFPCTPRLQEFLREAVYQFAQIVHRHQGGDPRLGGELPGVGIAAGPYEGEIQDYTWHQDNNEPGDLTYVATLLGEATLYSQSPVRRSDFGPSGVIDNAAFSPEGPLNTISYGPLVVSAHDALVTPHRGPGPEYNGHPRIRLSSFTRRVLLAR